MFNSVAFAVLICIFPACFDLWCLGCFVCLTVFFVCYVALLFGCCLCVSLGVLGLAWP